MYLLSSFAPSPREWLAGALLLLLLPTVYRDVAALFPHEPPVVGVEAAAAIQPTGRWRVERTVRITELCGTALWSRTFKGSLNGEPVVDMLLPAVAASLPGTLEPVTRGGRRPPGTYTDWWEYELPPGFRGVYIVSVALADCPSGFNDLVQVYVVNVP